MREINWKEEIIRLLIVVFFGYAVGLWAGYYTSIYINKSVYFTGIVAIIISFHTGVFAEKYRR